MKNNNLYVNRELSWLMFNERVLQEAESENTPLFERLNFVSIFCSNLDEFYMVRTGSLIDLMEDDEKAKDGKTKLTAKEQLDAIYLRTRELMPRKDLVFSNIIKQLKTENIEYVNPQTANEEDLKFLKLYFEKEIMPVCSVHFVDSGSNNPFPFFDNKMIYVGVHIADKNSIKLAYIPTTGEFEKTIFLPGKGVRFALAEQVILHFANKLLKKSKIISKSLFRITRNADISVDEIVNKELEVDYRQAMSELLQKRKSLSPLRLELSYRGDRDMVTYICNNLGIKEKQVFETATPFSFGFVGDVERRVKNRDIFYPERKPQKSPQVADNLPMIAQIQKKDIFLHCPYESIEPFIRLLNEASEDPKVESIKITLYRVASDSKVIGALVKAAENGKQVSVMLELRARFDEKNNIDWSKTLEEAGVKVSYGLPDYKVHSKLLLITRKTNKGVEYITQIGTGNYNEKTAKLYTDMCLMTANREIGEDAKAVFDAILSYKLITETKQLLVSPLILKKRVMELIDQEIEYAKRGEEAKLTFKLNSLTDKPLIDKLVEASKAGVKVDMIIRGICCLKSGIPEETENIRVISIVGRYLEHARVYHFGVGARERFYIASADFMTRNTDRRVEVATPILNEEVKDRVRGILSVMLSDNVKARIQQPDGTYRYVANGETPIDSQMYFYNEAYEKAPKESKNTTKQGFFKRLINRLKGE